MNDAATNLDRLHDMVEPPPVAWWPVAPGWWVLLVLVVAGALWGAVRCWQRWRANAYRRQALRELDAAQTPAEIAELLRRTALAAAPREDVACLTGERWADWLAASTSAAMPASVREQLARAIYVPGPATTQPELIRQYAKTWITQHRAPVSPHR